MGLRPIHFDLSRWPTHAPGELDDEARGNLDPIIIACAVMTIIAELHHNQGPIHYQVSARPSHVLHPRGEEACGNPNGVRVAAAVYLCLVGFHRSHISGHNSHVVFGYGPTGMSPHA